MTRRWDNLEGAFPLLLIGSVLLVYAAILANQEFASKNSHLPLWGLIGGVGAVIVGAGIYSTFLEPDFPPAKEVPRDWVVVPKAEWDGLRAGRPKSARPAPTPREPDWWEGPPERSLGPARTAPRRPLKTGAWVPEVPRRPTRSDRPFPPAPLAPHRGSVDELEKAMAELESLVNRDLSPSPARRRTAKSKELVACRDCDRALPADPAPSRCSGCGSWLCDRCSALSQAEDGELRCIECRAREP